MSEKLPRVINSQLEALLGCPWQQSLSAPETISDRVLGGVKPSFINLSFVPMRHCSLLYGSRYFIHTDGSRVVAYEKESLKLPARLGVRVDDKSAQSCLLPG